MRTRVPAVAAGTIVFALAGFSGPAVAQPPAVEQQPAVEQLIAQQPVAQPPSDDCSLLWVTNDELEPGYYFGDARLQCPVAATVGARWELDGQTVESYTEQLGPGEVPVFDDLELTGNPGQELCFVVTAWGNDKGQACLMI